MWQVELEPLKERHVKMIIAFNLGVASSRESTTRIILKNVDEMHFVMNMDNGKTLGFRGNQAVKYADVISKGEAMTMVVRITGGVWAAIMAPMIIFTNQMRNYPIRRVENNVLRICYQTGPKGWMDMELFLRYFAELWAYQRDAHQHLKHVWCDNLSSHNLSSNLDQVLR